MYITPAHGAYPGVGTCLWHQYKSTTLYMQYCSEIPPPLHPQPITFVCSSSLAFTLTDTQLVQVVKEQTLSDKPEEMGSTADLGYESSSIVSGAESTSASGASQLIKVRLRLMIAYPGYI